MSKLDSMHPTNSGNFYVQHPSSRGKSQTLTFLLFTLIVTVASGLLLHIHINTSCSAHLPTSKLFRSFTDYIPTALATSPTCQNSTGESAGLPDDVVSTFKSVGGCQRIVDVCWDNSKLVVDYKRTSEVFNVTNTGARHWYTPRTSDNIQESLAQTAPQYQLAIPPVPVRARSHQETIVTLQDPVYSSCVVPVVVYTSEPWSYDSMLQHVGPWLYSVVDGVSDSVRQRLQLVVVTPDGLPLADFTQEMLQPMFENVVMSLSQASDRDANGIKCFKEMLVCTQNPSTNVRTFVQSLAARYTAGMKQAATTSKVLRVAFERPSDNGYGGLQNVAELVQQCSTAKLNGYSLWCSALTPTESVSSNEKTLQDVDVLVTAHGPHTVNAMLLPSGSSVIEVVPLDMAVEATHSGLGESELHWATLFVCSPEYSVPSDLEHTSGRPRALMPMLRNSKVPWGSIEKVLEGLLADKDKNTNQKQVFYALKGTTRPALPAEPMHRCPGDDWIDGRESNTTASRDKSWRGPYPKHYHWSQAISDIDGGVQAIWQVPAFPTDVLLLFNGGRRPAKQWFPPSPQCPQCCKNCIAHHQLTKIALEMRMAVIALQFVEKRSDRYPYWRPNRGRAYEPIEPSNLPLLRGSYDARADPWESIDLPKIRRTIQAIVKNERLQGLRLFSAGFSAGASFTYTMAAAMPEIQGMLIMSQPSVNLNVYISQMAQQQRKFPPAAIVYHPMDAGRAKQNARDIQTLHEENVPVLEITSWPFNATAELIQNWMLIDTNSSQALFHWLVKHKLVNGTSGEINYNYWGAGAILRLAETMGEAFPWLEKCNFAQWLFHTQGMHYVDCTYCKEILHWLRRGGVERSFLPPKAFVKKRSKYPPGKGEPQARLPDGGRLLPNAPEDCW